MATTKTRTKSAAPKSDANVTVTLGFTKATKNTVRYDAADQDAALVTSLYIKKEAFPNGHPEEVTLTIA